MKNYILPTLISLVLSSSAVLAAETAVPLPAQPPQGSPPAAAQAAAPDAAADIVQLREAHKKSMQELARKVREAKDPEERQRLIAERMQEMQQHIQEMQELMGQPGGAGNYGRGGYGPGPGYGMGPGPGWGGGPGYGPGGYYGPAMEGGPQGPRMGRMSMMHDHQEKMEQYLARITELLEKIVANQGK